MVCSSARRKEAFTDEVYLEGFTIEGGTYNGTSAATQYAPGCGAGVYINDPSARMRYCTVRFCNPGMKESGSIKPRGGGIYCKTDRRKVTWYTTARLTRAEASILTKPASSPEVW